jgi:hypothetical protein
VKALEKCYPLIGRVVVEFQNLEGILEILIVELLVHKDFKNRDLMNKDFNCLLAVMASLTFSKKVDLIRSIAPFKLRYQDLFDSLKDIVVSLTRAEEKRNSIVHAHWMAMGDERVVITKPRTSRKVGLIGGGLHEVTTAKIEEALAAIREATNKVADLGSKLTQRGVIKTKMFTIEDPKE